MKTGSLFSGYGGLDLAVAEFFGAETVWHSEIDPGACQILAHHWPAVPNLGDITKIRWLDVPPIDLLAAGWPCQPFSPAGLQLGAADERALWPYVGSAIRALRPRHVVLENVAAIASAGELARAVGDLAALGYVGGWRCVRASDIGAPHERARIFIAATDTQRRGREGQAGELRPRRRPQLAHGGDSAADASGAGLEVGAVEPDRDELAATERNGRDAAAHTNGVGLQGVGRLEPLGRDFDGRSSADTAWGAYEPAIRRWERIVRRAAPSPTELSRNGRQRLSPAFVEWMQGLPAGHVTEVPGVGRNAQLQTLGNGVVPQQALEALRRMWPEAVAA